MRLWIGCKEQYSTSYVVRTVRSSTSYVRVPFFVKRLAATSINHHLSSIKIDNVFFVVSFYVFYSVLLCFDCVSVCIFFVQVESNNPLGSDVFSLLQPLFVLCGLPTPLRPTVKGSDKEPASVTLCHSATALTPYWDSTCLPAWTDRRAG